MFSFWFIFSHSLVGKKEGTFMISHLSCAKGGGGGGGRGSSSVTCHCDRISDKHLKERLCFSSWLQTGCSGQSECPKYLGRISRQQKFLCLEERKQRRKQLVTRCKYNLKAPPQYPTSSNQGPLSKISRTFQSSITT